MSCSARWAKRWMSGHIMHSGAAHPASVSSSHLSVSKVWNLAKPVKANATRASRVISIPALFRSLSCWSTCRPSSVTRRSDTSTAWSRFARARIRVVRTSKLPTTRGSRFLGASSGVTGAGCEAAHFGDVQVTCCAVMRVSAPLPGQPTHRLGARLARFLPHVRSPSRRLTVAVPESWQGRVHGTRPPGRGDGTSVPGAWRPAATGESPAECGRPDPRLP